MGEKIKPKQCEPGECWGRFEGEWGCWHSACPVRKLVITFGGSICEEGYTEWGKERTCVPCQEIKYICPDNPLEIQKKNICQAKDDQPKDVPAIFALATKELLDLHNKNCEVKTPGFFYDTLQIWRGVQKEQPKTSQKITQKAEYLCETRLRQRELSSVFREVSVEVDRGEDAEAIRGRLEKAAKDLMKTIQGCHKLTYVGLSPLEEKSPQVRK